jgi:hypothetical protein
MSDARMAMPMPSDADKQIQIIKTNYIQNNKKLLYCFSGGWLWGLHYDQAGKCMAFNLFRQIFYVCEP